MAGKENVSLRMLLWGGGSGWEGGRVCTRRVGPHVTAKKIKICSHLRVDKNPYPQDVS